MKTNTLHSTIILFAIGLIVTAGSSFAADVTGDRLNIGSSHSLTGTEATIAGGQRNTNAGLWSAISGGSRNVVGDFEGSAIGGGIYNTISNHFSTIAGGANNYVCGGIGSIGGGNFNRIEYSGVVGYDVSTIGGGEGNHTFSYYCTIGGGQNNVVSGPGGTVAGGIANTAGALSATVAGGVANTTSGDNSVMAGGYFNTISNGASYAAVGGGYYNESGGSSSVIGGGYNNQITSVAAQSTIAGGQYNKTTAAYSSVPGGLGAVASHYGQFAVASGQFGSYSDAIADAQASLFVLRQTSSNTNKVELFLDGSSQRLTIPVGATWLFDLLLVARSSTGNSSGWQVRGVIKNVAGTVTKIGSFTKTAIGEDVTAWALDINSDDVNDCLSVKATGDNSSIRWVASVRTVEVGY